MPKGGIRPQSSGSRALTQSCTWAHTSSWAESWRRAWCKVQWENIMYSLNIIRIIQSSCYLLFYTVQSLKMVRFIYLLTFVYHLKATASREDTSTPVTPRFQMFNRCFVTLCMSLLSLRHKAITCCSPVHHHRFRQQSGYETQNGR